MTELYAETRAGYSAPRRAGSAGDHRSQAHASCLMPATGNKVCGVAEQCGPSRVGLSGTGDHLSFTALRHL